MQSDNLYQTIYENAIEGIFQSTPEGHFISANPSLATICGYKSSKELLKSITNIAEQVYVVPNRRQQFLHALETDGVVKNFVSEVYKKDKTKIWISENARIVRDNNGDILYFEGFISDITTCKESATQNELIENKNFQREKIAAMHTMARGLGHDLNNILSPILGYTEMLLEVFSHTEKVEKYIKNIYKSAKRARDLVQHIHYLGKAMPIKQQPFLIEAVIGDVVKSLSQKLPEAIKIKVKIDPQVKMYNGDSLCIQQILFNLCENGIQAMENSGGILEISITEKNLLADEIETTNLDLAAGKYLVIKITDTGEGIEPQIINKIFDPYFSTRNMGIGHGLGLATAQSLIHSCLGEITVKSQPNQGSQFYVFLPLTQIVIQEEQIQSEPENEPHTQKHIMLVDDDDDVLQIQQQLIEHLGYKVTIFSDSQRALQSFLQNPSRYDLVLTDMNMPKMSGLVLSKQLLDINSHIPIILCTGFSESVNEATAKSVGIKKFIIKPLTTKKLSQDLHNVLNEKDH